MSQGVFNELFWVAGMVLTGDESQLLIIAEDAVEVEVHVIDLDTLEVEQRIGMLMMLQYLLKENTACGKNNLVSLELVVFTSQCPIAKVFIIRNDSSDCEKRH